MLRNALGKCKSEADRSESAIGVLRKCPRTLADTPRPPRDIALRSPPIREAESAIGVLKNALGKCKSEAERSESAIGVLRNALGMCKSEAERSESAIGVFKTSPKTLAITRGVSQTPCDIALRSPPIREAESAIGLLRKALGTC